MAALDDDGGDELLLGGDGERAIGGKRGIGRVGKVRGGRGRVCGTHRRRPRCRQKQEVAGVWLRAPGTRLSSSWREEGDDWQ